MENMHGKQPVTCTYAVNTNCYTHMLIYIPLHFHVSLLMNWSKGVLCVCYIYYVYKQDVLLMDSSDQHLLCYFFSIFM